MTDTVQLIPVILSGGTGSRLWPISRESHPKPFITLPDGQSLLQKTFARACHLANTTEIITITNKEYYLKSKAEYEKKIPLQTSPMLSFLLEPFARNTAAAIALAALKVIETVGPDALLLILPADHLITDITAFVKDTQRAITLANNNQLVTFGITPTAPETGFGYIEREDNSQIVKRFVEKPDAATAATYLASGKFFWNSGMYCFKASIILEQFKLHAPALLAAAMICWEKTQRRNTAVIEFDPTHFATLQDISIDYAIMEKAQNIAMIACTFDWQDIGSWEAYKKLFTADQHGNTILGDAVLIDSQNNFICSENRMMAAIGIHDLTIIDTPDALLITHRDRTQDVRQIVQTLKSKAHESYMTHRTVHRPWGTYTVLEESAMCKIKRIVVKPNASLSLQQHQHRSEHWVVVEGTANVINGTHEVLLHTNESTFVPSGTPHRLSNPGTTDLVIIEVQTGTYLGEDDIIRFEDTYGRIPA